MSVPDPSHPKNLLSPSLEALLFVASEPVSPAQLASILETSVADVEKGLAELAEVYRGRGLQLERHAGLVRLTTAPEMAPLVERFLGLEATTHLSQAALERPVDDGRGGPRPHGGARAVREMGRAGARVDAEEPIIEYNAACVYVKLGRVDDALRCLEVSVGQGGLWAEWAANDPDLDPLRGDPRFVALLSRAAH